MDPDSPGATWAQNDPGEKEHPANAEVSLLPARMVNEFAYCPRLFYLMLVRGQWAENAFTIEGSDIHHRVDTPAGIAPEPDGGARSIARGVELSSERLGVVAKIDLVEFDGEVARPVDYKRGRPAPIEGRVWEPERIQLCLQGLLLREAGYAVREGVIYFAATNERVTVPFTPDLEARAVELVQEARAVADASTPPPPLVDSPKCPACVLVSVCMPDELNLLYHRRRSRPRTLITRDPPARPLYLVGHGTVLRKEGNHLVVQPREGEPARIRAIDVSHVAAFGTVSVTTNALQALLAQGSPVVWLTRSGRFLGMATGFPGKDIELRRQQFTVSEARRLACAREFVVTKIRNQRTLLRRNARAPIDSALAALREAAIRARMASSIDALRGIEGFAARIYFQCFSTMLRPDVPFPDSDLFRGRNRRPPRDPVNALLSFLYTLLTKDLAVQAHVVGFDPYEGFFHRPKFGRPALALDLAEEFRPLIADSVVLTMVNTGEMGPADFRRLGVAVVLTDDGRRKVLHAYERRLETEVRHPRFGYRLTYRRVLDLQVRMLAAAVLGELAAYEGFETR
jgi:CRISPR-associated protein Cas1